MRSPYENTLIGYFLYTFGYYCSENNKNITDFHPNLFQQTPADKYIGDLLLNSNSKYLIIEFKRDIKNIQKEIEKKGEVIVCLKDKGLYPLSHECHFISFGDTVKNITNLFFMPYMDIVSESYEVFDYKNFFNQLFEKDIGLDLDEFKNYFSHLIACNPYDLDGCGNCVVIEVNENLDMKVYELYKSFGTSATAGGAF